MGTTLEATFDTRRDAEMTIERLVQQFGIARTDMYVTAEGDANTAGIEQAGSDAEAGAPNPEPSDDAELNGRVVVSVDVADGATVDAVRAAFAEFDADAVSTH